MKVKKTERGWAGHFICAYKCRFKRNTLLECGNIKIVVSTVGNMISHLNGKDFIDTIGHERYYETMAFHAEFDGEYWDVDVCREVPFESQWSLNLNFDKVYAADNLANKMHETVVAEITQKLKKGELNG